VEQQEQLRLMQEEKQLREEQEHERQVHGWLTDLDFLGDELAARGYGVRRVVVRNVKLLLTLSALQTMKRLHSCACGSFVSDSFRV
jgi:hypothetical protein